MTREDALLLVREYTSNENLVKHMLAVEAAMRAYAAKFNESVEEWGICGLLHDFDYEKMGSEHPSSWGYEILRSKGIGEETIVAIQGHVDAEDPSTRPTMMAKALFACDELTGFIVACALPRPGQLSDLEASSVVKKMKDKAFAKAIDRTHLTRGAEELGLDLNEHVQFVIEALRLIKDDLGLK